MAESNKSYFDALPDEIILMILEQMEGLTDRFKMARVSKRFNRLANDRMWRKRIFISREEFKKISDDETAGSRCLTTLLEEIKHSKFFETLILEKPRCTAKSIVLFQLIQRRINSLSNNIGTSMFITPNHFSHSIFFFSPPNNVADYGRTLSYHPTNMDRIIHIGKDTKVLEKIVNYYKDTLLELCFKGEITLSLLRQLGKCKKLNFVNLVGQFNLSKDINDTELPRITAEVVSLRDPSGSEVTKETSYMIRDVFFSDALHLLKISFYLLRGVESEICQRCPNLRIINIDENSDPIPSDIYSDFCNNFIIHLNNHSQIYEVHFYIIYRTMYNILTDSINRDLTVNYNFCECNDELSFPRQRTWSLPPLAIPHWLGEIGVCRN